MSRHHNSNRSFLPSYDHPSSDSSSRRFHPSSQNDFSYFQYPSHRQVNNHRTTTAARTSASTPHYRVENPSTRQSSWSDHAWEEHRRPTFQHTKRPRSSATNRSDHQSYRHYERKRSRHDGNEYHQSYSHHRSTNPTSHYTPSFSRSLNNESHNRSAQSHQQSMPSSNAHYHGNGMSFESTSYQPPLFHQTSMSTHIQQRPSPSFLLTDLFHRIIDTHAAAYSNYPIQYHHHQPPPPVSIDMISYTWMLPNHQLFSLPTAFSIPFGDFFDLTIPDETPAVGLTTSELERLPTVIYPRTWSDIEIDDKCAVCLSEYTNGEKVKRLRCKHYFHSDCIDPWLKTSIRCPICRGDQTK